VDILDEVQVGTYGGLAYDAGGDGSSSIMIGGTAISKRYIGSRK